MPKLNENYLKLKQNYLFADIRHRIDSYCESHPEEGKRLIRLGIGDVTLPLPETVIKGLHEGVDAQANAATFRGYGPEQGYDETRHAIAAYYKKHGIDVDFEAVFVSDGAKSDTGNVTDIFGNGNVILCPDPVYPVYVDTNTMCGRDVVYMNGTVDNGFLPMPDKSIHADLIYICSPNNPTGACYTREQLKEWVDYALENEAVILFDSAYEAFPRLPDLPEHVSAIPSFLPSWYLRPQTEQKCHLTLCGQEGKARNSTEYLISFRRVLMSYFRMRVLRPARKILIIIREMLKSSQTQ